MALNNQPPAGGDPNNPNPGAPPAFDPKAFGDGLMAQFTNMLNGFAASQKKEFEKFKESITPPPPGDPDPNAPPAPEPKNIADLNIKLGQMEKVIKTQGEALEAQTKKTAEAEAKAAEEKRIGSFNSAIADIPFASPKAREQFRDAYLGKVKYAEDGSLIVETDKGPVSHDVFLKAEAENSPHFLAPQGHGGAGASPGNKPGSATKINVFAMTPAEIQKLSPADRNAVLADALAGMGR